jgi:sugar phosphate isomerase/epimerase
MQRVLSTYLFVRRRLTAALLEEVARAGFTQVEIFCARSHFDYSSPARIRELHDWLEAHGVTLHSLHSPTERDFGATRESGLPISISDPERSRRLEAVDEVKRALDVAEIVPFRYFVQHVCSSRDVMDPRQWDAAFSSLEHLMVFAKQRGVTLAVENTPNEMATAGNLRRFLVETRLHDLRLCFDVGHAHLQEGVTASLEAMGDLVATTHVHDNHGEKDEHLPPFDGTVNWNAAAQVLDHKLPLVLELKESAGEPRSLEPPPLAGALQTAREAFDRLENVFAAKKK